MGLQGMFIYDNNKIYKGVSEIPSAVTVETQELRQLEPDQNMVMNKNGGQRTERSGLFLGWQQEADVVS